MLQEKGFRFYRVPQHEGMRFISRHFDLSINVNFSVAIHIDLHIKFLVQYLPH